MSADKPPRATSSHPGAQAPAPGGISRWLPHPALSALLAVAWLLLQQSLAPAHLLSAVVLALLVPRLVHRFIGTGAQPRRPGLALRFAALVLWDIVVSNIAVARLVLSPAARPQPAWVVVPLDTRHPTAMALLASVITMTPGTVSCVVDDAERMILVHALDCSDPAGMAAQIKSRYEQPLMEIFG
jgi:multicomponent K+:H+ antiporter subunit E